MAEEKLIEYKQYFDNRNQDFAEIHNWN